MTTLTPNQDVFDNTLDLRGKKLKFRKWKAKDKKNFIKKIKTSENVKERDLTNELVYDCLEDKNIALSIDEFRYVISKIREKSLGSDVKFELFCDGCKTKFNTTEKIGDIIKQKYKKYKNISVNDIDITIDEPINVKFYYDTINRCETDDEYNFVDFLLRIKKINDIDTFKFDELVDYFDNLDITVLDEILTKWEEMCFVVDDVKEVECPHCKAKQKYKFDIIPDFFPENWTKR